jgi:hypothetical protein
MGKGCATGYICEAAQVDGVICADDECDYETGMRTRPVPRKPRCPPGRNHVWWQEGKAIGLEMERRCTTCGLLQRRIVGDGAGGRGASPMSEGGADDAPSRRAFRSPASSRARGDA